MRVVISREPISATDKVWVAQLIEHDFAVQTAPWDRRSRVPTPDGAIDALIDLLDTHQLICLRDDFANPVERVRPAPDDVVALWEQGQPFRYHRDPKRERMHEEGKPNPFPMWSFDIRLIPIKRCTSYDYGHVAYCSPQNLAASGLMAECEEEAFVMFRHPTLPVGHARCTKCANADQETFDKAGWIRERI